MSLPSDNLDLAVLVYRSVENRQVDGRNVSGRIPDAMNFLEVKQSLERHELYVSDDEGNRHVEISAPGTFHLSLEDMLKAAARRLEPQARFYLADIDYLYEAGDEKAPVEVKLYFEAAKLFRLLKSVADYVNEFGAYKSLVFLQKTKLELAPDYEVKDLKEVDCLDYFDANFVQSDIHKEQKATIIKTVLFEKFVDSPRITTADVIAKFGAILDGVKSNYELYVSEFSFQKVKEEVEKDKLEFTSKLNKVFSDIQSQLLAVPASIILVGGQMESASHWSLKNVLIWVGALVYAVLMDLLVSNQRNTLEVVKAEIEEQWELIRGRHQSIAEKFSKSYGYLDNRYKHQRHLLLVVDGLVAFSLLFSTWMLLHYSIDFTLQFWSSILGLGAGLFFFAVSFALSRFRKRVKVDVLPSASTN
ncbi:MAG TPA: hypothetical protein VME63_18365 [Dyella sp.]|uniref:hypothetical protein n=1 Tax=Dyella sp. TaxID=1869338 RepID=UPI002C86B05A|nr:hypothetical protein [Dyella sp.]HTV87365.1 hypothetical protein [Dyella sp.]